MSEVQRKIDSELVLTELEFLTSRSSGPGGQNVNKVNTKVTAKFDVGNSQILTEEEKDVIREKLSSKITKEGFLMVSSQDKRSQLDNKQDALNKIDKLFERAFTKEKPRKRTKPSKAAKEERFKDKKQRSEKKQWRQKLL
jgi:ribosome-associated protein